MTKNRMHEARIAHREYRHGTMSDVAIEEEFQALKQGLLDETEQGKTSELFQGNNLKRTSIVAGVNFFQQATGQAFASQYGKLRFCPFSCKPKGNRQLRAKLQGLASSGPSKR